VTGNGPTDDGGTSAGRRRLRSTVVFAAWTAVSRVAGLAREIIAAAMFGTSGMINLFTLAFQVPNLLRSLVADSALSAAFIPVFTELEERDRADAARRLAMSLAALFSVVIGLVTLVAIIVAPWVMPLLAPGASAEEADQLVLYAQIMFPIVPLLALTGLVMALLQIGDRFGATAFAPVLWNLVIIGSLGVSALTLEGDDRLIGYAVGIVVGTIGQLLFLLPWLRGLGPFPWPHELWNDDVRRVITLMLPVVIGLGLINVNLVVGSVIANEVNLDEGVQPLNLAFRLYILPQGVFSVAVATVLFPAIGRLAARGDLSELRRTVVGGLRQIFAVLVPASLGMILLAEPVVRLVYERGEFDAASTELTAGALLYYSLGLVFNGASLLVIRTFFGLQRPWVPTGVAGLGVVLFAPLAWLLSRSMGIDGIALATSIVSLVTFVALLELLRRWLGGISAPRLVDGFARLLAAGIPAALVALVTWWAIDAAVGRELWGQILSLGAAALVGTATLLLAAFVVRLDELRELARQGLSLP
jgi:putative peptidoglycan lipid II flippase